MSRKITVQRAAELLGKSTLFVREAMRRGTLPIGTAEQLPGSSRWTFIISPTMLADYMGCRVEDLYEDEMRRAEVVAPYGAGEFSEEQIERLWRAFIRALREEGVKAK